MPILSHYSKTSDEMAANSIHRMESKKEEIKNFNLYLVDDFGKNFNSQKGFVERIEKLLINFYEAYVHNSSN